MGNCDSAPQQQKEQLKEETDKSKNLDLEIRRDKDTEQNILKLLLLGAGESGKSTLFKQLITLYGKGYSDQERASFKSVIFNNVITSMQTLCDRSPYFGGVSESIEDSRKYILELKGTEDLTPQIANHIKRLWDDPGIQRTFAQRNRFQCIDSAPYYFDKVGELSLSSYTPSYQDVLRARVRTFGIVETEFEINPAKFKMFDVGGQRSQRKKWIHCFENVTAVIFVAAISEYDQVLQEDESCNRVVESLNLFNEICNSRWFVRTAILLFLNKRDIFAEKLSKVPISDYFSEYKGTNTFDEASQWFKLQFESKNRKKNKPIYTHITCATDTNNVKFVFEAVKDIIVRQAMAETGLDEMI